jgi:hypothetical protein
VAEYRGRSTWALGDNVHNAAATESHQRPPQSVIVVLCLVAAVCLIAQVRSALMKDWTRPAPAIGGMAFLALVSLLWLYGLWRRLNWVRWTTIVLGVGGCLLASRSIARLHDPTQIALYWVQFALTVPTIAFLLAPSARVWYARRVAP